MQISDATSVASLFRGVSTGGGSTIGAAGSPFGADYLLSVVGGATSGSLTANSLLSSVSGNGNRTGFEFNLGAAYGPSFAAPTTPTLSEPDRKAQQVELKKALAFIETDQFEQAGAILDALSKKYRNDPAVVHTYGTLELSRGNFDKAESFFRRADYFGPGRGFDRDADNARLLKQDDDTVMKQARRLLADNNSREDGLRLLANLVDRSPENSEAHTMLAEGLLKSRDIPNAISEFLTAVEFADQAQISQLQGRFKQLIEIAPQASYAHRLMGQTLLKQGRFEEAAKSLKLATKLSDGDIEFRSDEALAHIGLGESLLKSGDVTAALAEFEQARDLSPSLNAIKQGYANALYQRGVQVGDFGDVQEAVLMFRKAAGELSGVSDESLKVNIARAAYAMGLKLTAARVASGDDITDEVVAYQTAHDLDPQSTKYRDKLAETRYQIGNEFLADGEFEDAAAAFQRAFDLQDDNTTYRDAAIDAYRRDADKKLQLNKFDEALAAYKAAYALKKDDDVSKGKLANGYNARGLNHKTYSRFRDAAIDFREALALYPNNSDYQTNYDSVSAYLDSGK